MKPTFLYIGVARAGSTWLYECLREHPGVFVPGAKDIEYFDNNYGKGEVWYLSFFKPVRDEKAVGELSHDYYLCTEAAERIQALLPGVKLICCLREPVDKMTSHLRYARKIHGDKVDFDMLMRDWDGKTPAKNVALDLDWDLGIHAMRYYEKLKPFFDRFPEENILVLFYDQLREDPAGFIRRVYSFLGVDEDFKPGVLNEVINPAAKSRLPVLSRFVYFLARLFRRFGLANIVGAVKRNKGFRLLFYTKETRQVSLTPEQQERVRRFCREDLAWLREAIGEELPVGWLA
jgi:hypothetical protein